MKFRHVLKQRANVQKLKEYEFDEKDGIMPEDFEKGKAATLEKPHFVAGKLMDFKLYTDKNGNLNVVMFHSYDKFEEF